MKRFLIFIALVILAAIALSPLVLGAPVPKPKPYHKIGKQVVPGEYSCKWGGSLYHRLILYKDGVYEQYYTFTASSTWNPWIGMWMQNPGGVTTQHILGNWTWDAKDRIFTMKETWQDGSTKNGSTYKFKLKVRELETYILTPPDTSQVYLSLRPLKE